MKVISFEGIGGAGKSTLIKQLVNYTSQLGNEVLLHKPISRKRLEKTLAVFPGKKQQVWVCNLPWVPPKVEALCYLSFLMYDCKKLVGGKGKFDFVYFDRYIDTVSAHVIARNNILGRKLPFKGFYEWFNNIYREEIVIPDKTLILDVSLEIAEQRTVRREGKRYSKKDRQGFRVIKDFYDFLLKQEPERFVKIDANRELEEVIRQSRKIIKNV